MRLNVFGPPGSGKTTLLTRTLTRVARVVGPSRVAAVTYTRAAAQEMRSRVGAALGLPQDPQVLAREMPWIGTIHSIAWRLLGKPPLVGERSLASFAEELGYPSVAVPTDDSPYPLAASGGRNPFLTTLASLSRLRHQMTPPENADQDEDIVNELASVGLDVSSLADAAKRYEEWKRSLDVLDYEDLLIEASRRKLPVQALLLDEAQDNSALLWKVLESWCDRLSLVACFGDPWQAIYTHAGADPNLFLGMAGRRYAIRRSPRLPPADASYAQLVLRNAGWDHPWLNAWEGTGDGQATDGAVFYLARTRAIVERIERNLIQEGEPFLRLGQHRTPLWDSGPAKAYRVATLLLLGEAVDVSDAQYFLMQALGRAALPADYASSRKKVTRQDVERATSTDIARLRQAIKYSDYFSRVEALHGVPSLFSRPRKFVGTIHAAKGREADTVYLNTSWGWIPGRMVTLRASAAIKESCVAYVGVSRHRKALHLVDDARGLEARYPFP